ncbi:hypothetical protein [Pseudomonas sp.]|uniref:hypothetical protein n=1 Tax=Pseudomonas sp. TaxID=306 RepID=UPI002FC86575
MPTTRPHTLAGLFLPSARWLAQLERELLLIEQATRPAAIGWVRGDPRCASSVQ